MKLLGVREAASMLDVHENTLRRWEQAGLVRAVKLPTGIRRFRPEDINRLHKEMYDDLAVPLEKDDESVPVAATSSPSHA